MRSFPYFHFVRNLVFAFATALPSSARAGSYSSNQESRFMKWRNLALIFSMAAPVSAFAQGGYAGAFLRNGLAARSEAMGRAYVAMAEGNEAAFYNPASVAFFPNRELTTSVRVMTLDRTFAYASFGLPIRPAPDDSSGRVMNGGLSLSWIHARVDDISARDFDGEEYATLSNSENAFALSFALQPNKRLALGLTGKVVVNRLPGVTRENGALATSSFGFDFGAMLQPLEGVRLGVAATNVNLKYTWKTEEVYERGTQNIDKFPRGLRAGVAVSRIKPWLTLAADFEKREFRDATIHFGALANVNQLGQLRLGLNHGQPAFGAGYRFGLFGKKSELHYAFVSRTDNLDSDHVFGWAFVF
jgi:hypothetical protein